MKIYTIPETELAKFMGDSDNKELKIVEEENLPSTKSINIGTPAVIFDKDNIYTMSGSEPVSAKAYQNIFEINNRILNNISPYIYPENAEALLLPVSNIMESNLKMIFENFGIALENIYDVYINRVNDIFYDENTNLQTFKIHPVYINLAHECTNEFCEKYLRASDEDREKIISFGTHEFAISYINLIGTNIYNDTRAQLVSFFSNLSTKENETPIAELMESIDRCFYQMMGDMTYEAGVFVQRFISLSPSILSNNIYELNKPQNIQ